MKIYFINHIDIYIQQNATHFNLQENKPKNLQPINLTNQLSGFLFFFLSCSSLTISADVLDRLLKEICFLSKTSCMTYVVKKFSPNKVRISGGVCEIGLVGYPEQREKIYVG